MKSRKLLSLFIFWVVFINGCSVVDDYMLGPDNTSKPTALKPITPKITFNKRWDDKTAPTLVNSSDYYHLTPVIKDNIIYSANVSGFVQARSKTDGKLLWSKNIKSPISSGPKVNNHLVVVGSEASVVALDVKDGSFLWRSVVSNQLLASPILSHDRVYAKTIDGQLFSFQGSNGKQLWRYAHGAPDLILRASSAPVVVGDIVLSGFADGKLEAFDAQTGRLVWQRNITYAKGHTSVERMIDIDSTPIVKDSVAYLTTYQGEVVALSLRDGQTLWRHKMSSFKNMTMDDDTLFIVDSKSHVWALNARDGMVLWQQKSLQNRGVNAPSVSKAGLVLTDSQGYLHILSTETGEELAQEKLAANKTFATPLVDNKDVYVLFENGLLTDYMMVS